MKTKRTTRHAKSAETSIYLSITARSHDEMVRKIDELHAGFCRPAPKLTKGRKD